MSRDSSKRGEPKVITKGIEARTKLLEGAKEVFEAVATTYGPVSGNVAVQKNVLGAIVTHDGVSVAREVFIDDGVQDVGAGLLVEASEKSNKVSGDGTSATVITGYNVHEQAHQRVVSGKNAMKLRKGINLASLKVKEEIDKLAREATDDELFKVAGISASDPELGKLVAHTIEKVGGVGVTVEKYNGLGTIPDVIDGVYFEKGYTAPYFVTDQATEEAVHENVCVLLLQRNIKQNQDIAPLIELVFKNHEFKTVLIVGKVSDKALETCGLTNLRGGVKICVVAPPVYGDQETPFLEDMAALTGGKVVPSSLPSDKVTPDFLGHAKKVIVSNKDTTIFEPEGSDEDVEVRIATIKEQLKSDKFTAFQKERMEMRLAKLQGKIGIIKVGGATETEQDEIKFRIEDAICATRAAQEEGVVPGGATTLPRIASDLRTSKWYKELTQDERDGVDVVLDALDKPFRKLLENAGEDAGHRFNQMMKSDFGYGFDVTEMTDEPINLVEKGVLDPAKVLKSVVENACSYASVIITIPRVLTIDRDFQREQLMFNREGIGQ